MTLYPRAETGEGTLRKSQFYPTPFEPCIQFTETYLEFRFGHVSPGNTLTILEVRNPSSSGSNGKVDDLELGAEILRLATNPSSSHGTMHIELHHAVQKSAERLYREGVCRHVRAICRARYFSLRFMLAMCSASWPPRSILTRG